MKYLLLILVTFSLSVFASDEIYTSFLSDKALSGYDAVSYFSGETPLKGKKEFKFSYKNTEWYFVSEENLAAFKKQPEKYEPQYGGYCAWAVGANGAKAPGDPLVWHVKENKLYLNYNESVQEDWAKDIPGFIQKADKIWPDLKTK